MDGNGRATTMVNQLTVSIITVCYNAEETIEQTIRSVLWQDYPHVEYVIVDGGSTDGTLNIIDRYSQGISKLVSEPDKGIYDAMNKGLRCSNGEIINFMNAGDYLATPDVLSEVAKVVQVHPTVKLFFGDLVQRGGGNRSIKYPVFRRYPDSFPRLSLKIHSLVQQVIFYRRDAFDVVGPFDQTYKIHADYDWNLHALFRCNLSHIHLPLVVCSYQGGGLSANSSLTSYVERRKEKQLIRRNYLSSAEHAYVILGIMANRLLGRIAALNFSMPISVRAFLKTSKSG